MGMHAFQDAPMLVEIALDLSSSASGREAAKGEAAGAVLAQLQSALGQKGNGAPIPVSIAGDGQELTRLTAAPDLRTAGPAAALSPQPSPGVAALPAIPGQASPLAPRPAPATGLRMQPGDRTAAQEPHRQPGPVAPPPAQEGRMSRFSAQLLAGEGGLTMLLRLPKLTASERAELEAGAARLLAGFGQRPSRIVIQEIRGE